jgi:hypothetical protein
MEYTVKATSVDGTAAGWILQYCKWEGFGTNPINIVVPLQGAGGVFYGTLDLPDGYTWRFAGTVADGHSVNVDIEPACPIVWPHDATWPVTMSGPAHGQDIPVVYFQTGTGE